MSARDSLIGGSTNGEERFLVTGSEGCIGSWIVRLLAMARTPVVALDLVCSGERLSKILDDDGPLEVVTFREADITAEGALDRVIAEHGITRVIHLAALQVPFVAADPVRGGMVNVVGTLRVFEAVRRARAQVKSLVYASSAAALGAASTVEGEQGPLTLYGAFKFCNEECARFYARDYGTPSIGLRPCVVYGPARDQGLTSAITDAMKAAALGSEYRIPFGGTLDLQYVEDVARFFVETSLLDANEDALVFNLHGDAVDTDDVIATIEELKPDASGLLSSNRQEPIPGLVDVDDAPLLRLLGPIEKVPLGEGVARSLAFFARLRDEGRLTLDELPAAVSAGSSGDATLS